MGASNDHVAKARECKIKRTRTSREHIVNCKSGYMMGTGLWQAHHILPISALDSKKHISASKENLEYIEDCLCVTNWNINATPNMMGLDNKIPYLFSGLYPLPPNLPSHLIDHNHYTQESYEYMEANVWDALKDAREIHKLDPKSIKSELDAATEYFEGELRYRGFREKGTIWCWEHRFDDGMDDKWYMPFSMSDSPNRRHRGIKYIPQFLTNIFTMIR